MSSNGQPTNEKKKDRVHVSRYHAEIRARRAQKSREEELAHEEESLREAHLRQRYEAHLRQSTPQPASQALVKYKPTPLVLPAPPAPTATRIPQPASSQVRAKPRHILTPEEVAASEKRIEQMFNHTHNLRAARQQPLTALPAPSTPTSNPVFCTDDYLSSDEKKPVKKQQPPRKALPRTAVPQSPLDDDDYITSDSDAEENIVRKIQEEGGLYGRSLTNALALMKQPIRYQGSSSLVGVPGVPGPSSDRNLTRALELMKQPVTPQQFPSSSTASTASTPSTSTPRPSSSPASSVSPGEDALIALSRRMALMALEGKMPLPMTTDEDFRAFLQTEEGQKLQEASPFPLMPAPLRVKKREAGRGPKGKDVSK